MAHDGGDVPRELEATPGIEPGFADLQSFIPSRHKMPYSDTSLKSISYFGTSGCQFRHI